MTEGKIKPGTIAYTRISEEPVFILSVKVLDSYHAMSGTLSGVIAKVRRPNVDKDGAITHNIEEFFIEELETEEDADLRKNAKLESLKAQFRAEKTATLGGNALAGSN